MPTAEAVRAIHESGTTVVSCRPCSPEQRGCPVSGSPLPTSSVTVGTIMRWSRRYTPADLALFAELSDREPADTTLDSLPDLLVIAPLTKLGGDLNYISRQMTWTVHRVVGLSDDIEAELEVTNIDETGSTIKIAFAARIRAADGELVISGDSSGVILKF
jgi:hypothetical protein